MREIALPLEEALSDTDHAAGIALVAASPLTGGFPPRAPLVLVTWSHVAVLALTVDD
ncbi:hypothetical protein [Streptomyces sp. KLMMK]|uniref:hypothetical protein n=1 Tax=Streptomyces sp. KLMMK TaxID=3109353 RepID=UPI002FFFB5B3